MLRHTYPKVYESYKELYNTSLKQFKYKVSWKDIYSECNRYLVGKNITKDFIIKVIMEHIPFPNIFKEILTLTLTYMLITKEFDPSKQTVYELYELYELLFQMFPFDKSPKNIILYNIIVERLCSVESAKIKLIEGISALSTNYDLGASYKTFFVYICRKLELI